MHEYVYFSLFKYEYVATEKTMPLTLVYRLKY